MKRILAKVTILMIVMTVVGCTMQKRQHSGGYHIEWASSSKTKNSLVVSEKKTHNYSEVADSSSRLMCNALEGPVFIASNDLDMKPASKFGFADAVESLMRLYNPPKDSCDRIIDKEGDVIIAKVTEIGIDIIKYKNCDHLDGPTYSIPKVAVLMIEYSNGKREVIKESKPLPKPDYTSVDSHSGKPEKRLEGLGLAGFIVTIASIPVWWFVSWIVGLVAGVLGIIFGSIGIHRCRKNPDQKWGKGFAITSLIIGLILTIVSIIFAFVVF